jgi:hypothetical protein
MLRICIVILFLVSKPFTNCFLLQSKRFTKKSFSLNSIPSQGQAGTSNDVIANGDLQSVEIYACQPFLSDTVASEIVNFAYSEKQRLGEFVRL